jgi:hypothetical protein
MQRFASVRILLALLAAGIVAGPAAAATGVKPSITSFTPSSAKATMTVTVNGLHFTKVKHVKIGTRTVTFKVDSAKKLTLTLPKTVKTGKIAVTTSAGTARSAKALKITA